MKVTVTTLTLIKTKHIHVYMHKIISLIIKSHEGAELPWIYPCHEGQHPGHAKGRVSAHKVFRPSGSWSQVSPQKINFIHSYIVYSAISLLKKNLN